MSDFLAELRRRHIFRIGGLYVVVAWGITQVIDVLSQIYALPDWIAQPILAVLLIGFPVTLLFAWTIIGAAKATDTLAELKRATTTDWALIAAVVAILAFMGYQQFVPRTVAVVETAETAVADEIVEGIPERLPNSIAVLPFANVSPNPDDAYFAEGIHDELISRLRTLRNLTVIARASVMKYADSALSLPEIAEELNVEMIMSGTVRLVGDQVRVTADLVDGLTNVPVWSEPYDGDLSDIFGIQAEIAMNIANSLQAEFSVEEQQRIQEATTSSPEAWSQFQRAMAIVRASIAGTDRAPQRQIVQGLLDQAIQLDPDFALAHAWKAHVYTYSRAFDPIANESDWLEHESEMDRLRGEHANRAVLLDPDLGLAHAELGALYMDNWRLRDAENAFEEALRLSPADADVLWLYSWVEEGIRDNPDEAVRYVERTVQLDPNNSQRYDDLGYTLVLAKRYDEAVEALQDCLMLNPLDSACNRRLAAAEFGRRNLDAALNALTQLEAQYQGTGVATLTIMAHGYGVLGQAESAQRIFDRLSELATTLYLDPLVWAEAYMGVGNYGEALTLVNSAIENRDLIQVRLLVDHMRRNFWSDPVLEEPDWLEVRTKLMAVE